MRLTIEVIHERDGDSCSVRLVSIRQNVDRGTWAWVDELIACDALGEFGFWSRMKSGDRVRQRLKIKLWSRVSYGYYGDEYDSGLDIIRERAPHKRHRGLSDKSWHRKHYRSKA